MPDPVPAPEESPGGQPLDLPFIREFDDRSSLWLLEDPLLLRGLLQILDPHLVERLDFAHARRINRSFIPADLQGKPVIAIAACYVGSVEDGMKALQPIKELGPPAVDLLGPIPYVVIVVAIALYLYARALEKKGVLS